MSAAGFTPIQLYRSTTASAAPTAGNLADGELAINTNDGKLYYKDSGGVVQLIASKAGASGDVVGPASATDNAVVRFDGATGKLVQNSVVTIADSTGDISGVGQLNATTVDATNIEVTNIKAIDGTAAASIANSTGAITVSTLLNVDNLRLDGNTLSSTNSNGAINLTPNGTGQVTVTNDALISGLTVGKGAGAVSTNTAVGASALAANTSGSHNAALGSSALAANTTGANSVAVGAGALQLNTTGDQQTAVGRAALGSTTTGSFNSASGWAALFSNTTGNYNTAFGHSALYSSTTTSNNTAVGYQAGYSNQTSSYNTLIGFRAGYSQTANGSLAIGYEAGYNTTTGLNTVVGRYQALYNNTTGSQNSVFGNEAMKANTTGSYNTALGEQTLYYNTTGVGHVAVGFQALYNTTTSYNTAFGYQAGFSTTSGPNNTFIGRLAGYSNQTGGQNTFVGYYAGYSSNKSVEGAGNVAVGSYAGYSLTTGDKNTFVGGNVSNGGAGYSITTGNANTIIGNYNGNQGGLDIRTASNYIVLSDGDGNPRAYWNGANPTFPGNINFSGAGFLFDTTDGISVPKTVTAAGTTGAQTINKTAGTVNFAATATSLVVTNSFVDANSIIIATVGTNDTTMKSVQAVAAAGSFTLYANAAATAETRVNFMVIN